MSLNTIKGTGNWGGAASDLNNNFASITADIEKLKAANVKFKGYYTTELTLKAAHPSPTVGDNAWVGAEYPGVVYRCDVAGAWLATTDVPPSNTVNLSEYATRDAVSKEFASIESDLSETTTALEQEQIQGGVYDVSSHNDGAVFESLSALLNNANLNTLIPPAVRHGGMSIRFIQGSAPNSDNKYVQARCMAQNFTTDVTQWQGVDDKPTAGSDNLVKSGGVKEELDKLDGAMAIEELIVKNVLEFEQGSLNSNGSFGTSDKRVRTKHPVSNLPITICVKDGWQIFEVYYYTSWVSGTDFVLDSKVVVSQSGVYTFHKENCVVAFSVRKIDNSVITVNDFLIDNAGISQSIKELQATVEPLPQSVNETNIIAGEYSIDDLMFRGIIQIELGSFGREGDKYDELNTRLRTISPVSNIPFILSVRDGWLIYEVNYYSSWISDTDFVFDSRVVVNQSTYRFYKENCVVAFSIRKIDNSVVTVNGFISENAKIKAKFDDTDNEIEQLKIEQLKVDTVKVTPQVFSEPQKLQARLNIDAAKAKPTTEIIQNTGLIFIKEIGDAYTDPSVNKMSSLNVFDKNNFKVGYRLDDSGQEVIDVTEGYTTYFIPARGGAKILCNCYGTKAYLYDISKNFIARINISSVSNLATIPAEYNSTAVGYVQLQLKKNIDQDAAMVCMVSLAETPQLSDVYVPFSLTDDKILLPNSLVWKNDYSGFNIYTLVDGVPKEIHNPTLFSDITPWEPASADSGYSNPTSGWGRDTMRADWTAEDKYLYYDFLAHYYDTYLGVYNDGDYKVTKKGLWQDGAHTGHEIFEYDFCPKNYKYIIMLSAGMNADETQGIWGLATFIRALMGEEETNMAIMKQNIRFKIIPIINASGFDQAKLRYTYSNGVNGNFNFNYKDSWERNDVSTTDKGEYPDSSYETVKLKEWVNSYSGKAVLWLDLHTGRWYNEQTPTNKIIVDARFSSISSYFADFNSVHMPLIKNFYIAKGTITSSDSIGGANSVRDNLDYQKHRYALDICGINSAMPEMHLESTGYGADGYTNNSVAGIKCHVLQVRQIIMYVINKYIADKVSIYKLPDLDKFLFRQ